MRILIVGGGVIGLSAAWRLADAGAEVVVLTANAAAPRASLAAAGMLAPSFEARPPDEDDGLAAAETTFGLASLAQWTDFAAALTDTTGIDLDFRRDGILGVGFDDDGAALSARADAMARVGRPAEKLSAHDARRLAPGISDRVTHGLFAPEDGQVDPALVIRALETAMRGLGVDVRAAVLAGLSTSAGGVHACCADGAVIDADVAVLAGGASRLHVDGAVAAPVRPVKGEAMAVDRGPVGETRGPDIVVRGPGAYLCPKADGRLVIGASEAEGDVSIAPDEGRVDALASAASVLHPDLAGAREMARWAGLRPGSPDGAPIIGPSPAAPQVICATGHHRNGILLAPATATMLSDGLLRGGAWPAAFSPARFDSA